MLSGQSVSTYSSNKFPEISLKAECELRCLLSLGPYFLRPKYVQIFFFCLSPHLLSLSSVLYLNNTLFKANWRPRENDSPLSPENCASSEGCSFSWRTGSPSLTWERKDHSEKRAPSYLCCSHAQTHTGMCSDAHRDGETDSHSHTYAHGHTAEDVCLFSGLKKYLRAIRWRTCEEDPKG